MNEIWKDIEGFNGLYQVSNYGNVRSFHGRVSGMKFKIDKDGYFHIGLTKEGKQRTFRVHRLVAKEFIENPLNLPEVNHKDLNKQNNNSDNLEWVSSRENKKHYHKDERKNTGVIKVGKTYRVQFTVNRKLYYIGVFKNYDQALLAYNEAFEFKDSTEMINKLILKHKQKFPRHVLQG